MPALWGLWAYWLVLAEHHIAGGLGRRCARIASEHPGDEQVQMMALAVNGFQALVLGEFARAADELEQVWRMEGVEPHQVFPHDPVSTALATHAVAAWFVGEAELARALAARAERMLEQLDPGHRRTALTRASVGAYLAWHAALDGDPYRSLALAEQAAAVATERQYPTWAAANLLHRAIALCHLERHQEGLPALEMLVAQWRAAGADATGRQLHPILLTPYFSGRLAETYLDVGEPAAAQRQLDQALRESASSGEAFWDAELLRLRAVARAASGDATGAADDLSAAQVVAARQGAGALEQRVDATASRT
jgi:tetratricopeptide (TPR) repeat protein